MTYEYHNNNLYIYSKFNYIIYFNIIKNIMRIKL